MPSGQFVYSAQGPAGTQLTADETCHHTSALTRRPGPSRGLLTRNPSSSATKALYRGGQKPLGSGGRVSDAALMIHTRAWTLGTTGSSWHVSEMPPAAMYRRHWELAGPSQRQCPLSRKALVVRFLPGSWATGQAGAGTLVVGPLLQHALRSRATGPSSAPSLPIDLSTPPVSNDDNGAAIAIAVALVPRIAQRVPGQGFMAVMSVYCTGPCRSLKWPRHGCVTRASQGWARQPFPFIPQVFHVEHLLCLAQPQSMIGLHLAFWHVSPDLRSGTGVKQGQTGGGSLCPHGEGGSPSHRTCLFDLSTCLSVLGHKMASVLAQLLGTESAPP